MAFVPFLARSVGGSALRGGASSRAAKAIRIDGLEELQANLERMIPGEAQKVLRNAAGAVAALIRDDIRSAMPAHVRHYKTAIAVYRPRLRKGEVAAEVVAKRTPPRAFYLHNIVEHGAQNRFTKSGASRGSVAAYPFKEPVVNRWRTRVPAEFQRALSEGLAKAWERRRTGTK